MATAKKPDYKDLDLDFIAHPVTKDVTKKIGPEAVARSIRNLVLTNFYDRLFQPQIGSSAQKLLFENMNSITENSIKTAIEQVIENYEPRARLIDVSVNADFDRNAYKTKVAFYVVNRPEPYVVTLLLERIR